MAPETVSHLGGRLCVHRLHHSDGGNGLLTLEDPDHIIVNRVVDLVDGLLTSDSGLGRNTNGFHDH